MGYDGPFALENAAVRFLEKTPAIFVDGVAHGPSLGPQDQFHWIHGDGQGDRAFGNRYVEMHIMRAIGYIPWFPFGWEIYGETRLWPTRWPLLQS